MDKILNELSKEFAQIETVEAVVLSGSQTSQIHDEKSDYDIYIYSSQPISLAIRENIAKKFTDKYVVGNTFFEDGDELNLAGGLGIDLMYRNLNWVRDEINWIWKNHNAKVGYTTCFLYNVKTSKILFDKNGDFKNFQDELNQPFPDELVNNIIARNYPLLREKDASYYDQLKLAVERNDLVSYAHRTSALLSSYFDIIFAINKQTHPGEKKLISYCEILCPKLPEDFKKDVENVVISIGTDNMLPSINKLLDDLNKIL